MGGGILTIRIRGKMLKFIGLKWVKYHSNLWSQHIDEKISHIYVLHLLDIEEQGTGFKYEPMFNADSNKSPIKYAYKHFRLVGGWVPRFWQNLLI